MIFEKDKCFTDIIKNSFALFYLYANKFVRYACSLSGMLANAIVC